MECILENVVSDFSYVLFWFGLVAAALFRYRLEALDYIVKGDASMMAKRVNDCLESICERLMNEPDGKGFYCSIKIFDSCGISLCRIAA